MFAFTNRYTLRSSNLLTNVKKTQLTKAQPISNIGQQRIIRFNSTAVKGEDLIGLDEYETKIYKLLSSEFDPKLLTVRDISGGCGSMFAIDIQSEKFNGLSMIKQHRLVNQFLKDEITKWHGLQLKTKSV